MAPRPMDYAMKPLEIQKFHLASHKGGFSGTMTFVYEGHTAVFSFSDMGKDTVEGWTDSRQIMGVPRDLHTTSLCRRLHEELSKRFTDEAKRAAQIAEAKKQVTLLTALVAEKELELAHWRSVLNSYVGME